MVAIYIYITVGVNYSEQISFLASPLARSLKGHVWPAKMFLPGQIRRQVAKEYLELFLPVLFLSSAGLRYIMRVLVGQVHHVGDLHYAGV